MRALRKLALALALAEAWSSAALAEAPKVMPTDPAVPQSLTSRPKETLKGQLRDLPTPYSIGAAGAVPPPLEDGAGYRVRRLPARAIYHRLPRGDEADRRRQ